MPQSALWPNQNTTKCSVARLLQPEILVNMGSPRISVERLVSFPAQYHDFVNPLSPDSAIWHKMQLHAQYSVNLCEICTTKRSKICIWKA